jgi:hypothetical protein
MLAASGDLTEDAPNYNNIDFWAVWVLFDLFGKEVPMVPAAWARFQAMFTRFLDQVSPSGVIASYGDSGGAANPHIQSNTTSWPWDNVWSGFVAGFERAATEFDNPHFRQVVIFAECTTPKLDSVQLATLRVERRTPHAARRTSHEARRTSHLNRVKVGLVQLQEAHHQHQRQ